MITGVIDYAASGLTLREAMIDHAKRNPNKINRPDTICWGDLRIKTFDWIPVPKFGVVRLEFLSSTPDIRQGADMELDGWIELEGGERVPLLRTWKDDQFEDYVEYQYFTKDGFLRTWNVYEMVYPNGQKKVERWTENAGFWVEVIEGNERIYHCSDGMSSPPKFDSLVYKLTINPSGTIVTEKPELNKETRRPIHERS